MARLLITPELFFAYTYLSSLLEAEGQFGAQEVRNERALAVYNRVQNKLTGRDFNPDVALSVETQVDKLIEQATSFENLCQCFSGWCAFW